LRPARRSLNTFLKYGEATLKGEVCGNSNDAFRQCMNFNGWDWSKRNECATQAGCKTEGMWERKFNKRGGRQVERSMDKLGRRLERQF